MEGFYPLRTRRKPPGRPLPSAHREGEQAAEGAEADEHPRRVVADVPAVQPRDRLHDRRRGALDRARPAARRIAAPVMIEVRTISAGAKPNPAFIVASSITDLPRNGPKGGSAAIASPPATNTAPVQGSWRQRPCSRRWLTCPSRCCTIPTQANSDAFTNPSASTYTAVPATPSV